MNRPNPSGSGHEGDDVAASPEGASSGSASDLPSLPTRFVQVFTAPGRLFEALRENPVWLGALLLVAAVGLATSLLIPEELIRESFAAQAPAGQEASPEALDTAVRMARIFGPVASVVGPFIVSALVAGVLMLVFSLILGGQATFRQLFSVTAHGMFIPMVGGLITVPLAIAAGDLQTTLALHLLVPGLEEGTYVYRLFHGLNVFSLGAAAVLGIGMARLYPRRSAGNAVAIVVGLYVAVKAVFALFGGFGGGPPA